MVIYKKRFILTTSDSGANFMGTGMALVGALRKGEALEQWIIRTQSKKVSKEKKEVLNKIASERSKAIKDLEDRLNEKLKN